MQIYDRQRTESALPFGLLIEAVAEMFVRGCEVPLRHNHAVADGAGGKRGTLLLMPAWQTDGWLGVKTVSVFPGNAALGLPGLHSVYILYRARTGQPVAVLDGDTVTSRRTAAASALAARYLSRADSSTLLVAGAGRVAALLADAYRSVRPIRRVLVWNPTRAKAEKLAGCWRGQGLQAEVCDSLADGAGQADIVSCATLSAEPLIRREWLREGTHLDLIGSFAPDMRESDDACFGDTSVFVDTEEALMKSGDLLSPMASGVFGRERLCATLYDLCRNRHPGRRCDSEITVFKSVGTALEDLAAAALAYTRLSQVQAVGG